MKKYNLLIISFLLIGFFSISNALSQPADTPKVHLRSGIYSAPTSLQKRNLSQLGFYTSADKLSYGYVQFSEPLTTDQFEKLENEGIQFIEYIPENTYYIALGSLGKQSSLWIKHRNGSAYFFQLPAPYKIDPMVLEGNLPLYAKPEKGYILVSLITAPQAQKDVEKYCNKNGIELIETHAEENLFNIKVREDQLETLAENPWVRFIQLSSPPKELKNKKGRINHRIYPLRNSINTAYPLLGEDIIVGQWDGGMIGVHQDLEGRISYHSGGYEDFHSTHVAGTILGSGLINPYMEGMAPAATLWASDFDKPESEIVQEMNMAYGDGVRVTNNSWGYRIDPLFCDYHFPYLASIQGFDRNAKEHPLLLHVFANGNDQDICPGGFYTGLWNMKNTLFVGAVSEDDNMSDFSSFGPTYDGRLIPHVSAVGVDVYSTVGVNSYYSLEGTSMSAPGVTGTIALLQEHYKNINNDEYPTAALLKAIICNTARDKGNVGPDYKFGFGVIDALKAVESISNSYYIEDEVDKNQEKTFTIEVPQNTVQLKALLTYTDKEGSVMATQALVNNLSLSVEFNGETHLPWKLDYLNPNAPATKGDVPWDNIKQVTIDNPTQGAYQIKVNGVNVPSAPQPFAISYWFEKEEITIVYPHAGVILNPGSKERLTWNAQDQNQSISLEISMNNGQSWETLGNANLSDGGFEFTVPQGATQEAMVRIVSNGVPTLSEKFTVLSTPSNLNAVAGFQEITLTWDAVEGADSYDVFQIKEGELHLLENTTNTNYTVQDLEVNKPVLTTVRSRVNNLDMVSQRAVAVTSSPIPMYDVGVVAFYSPVSGCHLSASEVVRVGIRNFGHHTFQVGEKIPVAYTLNSGGVNRDTLVLTQELPKGAVASFTFKKKAYMSVPRTYIFEVWTALESDSIITGNDKLTRRVENYNPITSFPYNQNFDNMPDLADQIGDLDGVFNPVYLSGGWDNDHENDDFEWWPNKGETLINGTGPMADHTSGEGKYLYTESEFLNGQVGEMHLFSPCFDMATLDQPTMYFWYHAFSEALPMGSLHVDAYLYDTQEWELDIMSPIEGSQGDQWKLQIVDLTSFRYMGSVKFRFRVITSTSNHNAFAIDDFKISDRYTNDLSTIDVIPKAGERILTDNETLSIDVVSYAKTSMPAATIIPVGFSIDDTLTVREEFVLPHTLNFSDTITIPFNHQVNLEGLDKRFNVDVWVEMPNDAFRFNDSIVGHKVQTYTEVNSKCFAGVSPTGIGNFYFNGIHESQSIRNFGTICGHTGLDGYSLTTNQKAVVYRGYEYGMGIQTIIVPSDWMWPSFGQYFKVWIDLNRDGYFSDDEIVYQNDSRSLLFEETQIPIPENAELGITRMRVRSSYHADEIMAPDAANGLIRFGETEDYVIEIRDYPTVDLEVLSIETPTSQVGLGTKERLWVNLRSRGSQPLAQGTALPFEIVINSLDTLMANAQTEEAYETGNIFAVELQKDFDFSQFGSYRITLINKFAEDLDPINDTAFAVVTNMKKVNALNYSEIFEDGPEGWWDGTELPQAIWELGEPQKTTINSSYTGQNVWITKLSGLYPAETEAILYSPIFDFTEVTQPYLNLVLNIKTEEGYDGMILESSTDGENWVKVNGGDALYNYKTNYQNWDMGTPWWSGFSVGWQKFGASLSHLAGQSDVMFRFRFRSDLYVEDEGIAIDNISITEYLPNIEIGNLISPTTTGGQLSPKETVKFTIKNIGNTIIPSAERIVVGTIYQGNTVKQNYTLTKPTRPGEQYVITLSKTLDLSSAGTHCFTVFAEMDDDIDPQNNTKEFCVESIGTGVNDHILSDIMVYPNPGDGKFTIELPPINVRDATWEVLNITGAILQNGKFTQSEKLQLDLTHLPAGIYLFQINAEEFNQMVRLIKY